MLKQIQKYYIRYLSGYPGHSCGIYHQRSVTWQLSLITWTTSHVIITARSRAHNKVSGIGWGKRPGVAGKCVINTKERCINGVYCLKLCEMFTCGLGCPTGVVKD